MPEPQRAPPPSLLRPPRRRWPGILATLGLATLAGFGGFILGLGLRPVPPQVVATAPTEVVSGQSPAPIQAPPAGPSVEALRGELATLRAAIAEETTRLADVTAQRIAAEAARNVAQRDQPPPREASRREPPAVVASRPSRPDAAATRPEPAAPGVPRVFVHYRGGSAQAAEAAAQTAALVREAGIDVADLRAVSAAPAQRVVRYFHAEDAATAARLAGRLGRGWAIQDFRGYDPSTAPQTLEIWLPDR